MILPERARAWLFPAWTAIAVFVVVGLQAWLWLDPDSLRPHLREHSLIETVTALSALAGVVIAVIHSVRSEHRVAWLALAGLCLFVAGEEVTWGQGLFWRGHTHVLGLYVDNAHDFFDVFLKSVVLYVRDSKVTVWFLLLVAGAAAGMTLAVQIGSELGREHVALLWSRPWRFVYAALVTGFVSQLVDNRVLDPLELSELERRALEEPLELVSALALLMATLSRGPRPVDAASQTPPSA